MPRTPEARRIYDAARRANIKADPTRLELLRKQGREGQRRRMQDPAKRAIQNARNRAWREQNHNGLDSNLRSKFGIGLAEYERRLGEQNGACAICQKHRTTRTTARLAVDHSHETGAVRGLLCYRCNVAIGMLNNPALLRAAAEYVEERGP